MSEDATTGEGERFAFPSGLAGLVWTEAAAFTVPGRPQPRGSKTPWIPRTKGGAPIEKNGRIVIATMDSNKKSKSYMAEVKATAAGAYAGDLLRGPIRLTVELFFQRPKSHFRSGKLAHLLRDDAPDWHCQTPDLDKVIRGLADSLKGVLFADDKQICCYGPATGKHWTTEMERAEITIETTEPV